jgi:glucokinase
LTLKHRLAGVHSIACGMVGVDHKERHMLIAGDIGGTKTLLALYTPERGPRQPIAQAEFRSADYDGLERIVAELLARNQARVDGACFCVAGPVIDGRAQLTNLPWVLEEQALCRALGLRSATLLNDLQAMAHAVPHLQGDELHTVKSGRARPHGAIAIIAPGTGLGEAFLVWNGSDYLACASEGGHADFAPTDELQIELLRYLRERRTRISYEWVCSGMGLPNIYDFLRDTGQAAERADFSAELAQASDRTPLIVEAALSDPAGNSLCALTLQTFVSILGAEAGNLALKVLATGGVYLGGGMPQRILKLLDGEGFTQAFVNKGRFTTVMNTIPVHVIVTRAALLGAALVGLQRLQGH